MRYAVGFSVLVDYSITVDADTPKDAEDRVRRINFLAPEPDALLEPPIAYEEPKIYAVIPWAELCGWEEEL